MPKPNYEKQFNLETYEALVAFNGDILFEWNLENDRFYTTPNLFDIFGYMPPDENFTAALEKSENIHPEDKIVIKEYLNSIQFTPHDLTNRKYYSKMEIRIKNIYRKYVWCKVQLIATYSAQNMPYKISGMITNIDFDKKHQETLLSHAQKDTLTGLYNKGTTQKLIDEWIKDKQLLNKAGVLALIDLDGFKEINDHFGHLFGDAVIADTATLIRSHFLASDIAGRIGGDEFLVFIREITSIVELKEKLKQFIGKLNRTYQSDNTAYTVSASIGASLYPAHGKTYDELFAKADQALYYIKQSGKNELMLYREKLPKTLYKEKTAETIACGRSFDENIIEYIFKIFYNTKDHYAAIKMLLAVLGKKLSVSRTFIYLKSPDGHRYEKTFEWHDAGVSPIDPRLNQIDAAIIDGLYQLLEQENLLICNDIQRLHSMEREYFESAGTKAFLHARMIHGDEPQGYIGFDECRCRRDWSPSEISLVNFLTDVFMTFISKHRLANELQAAKNGFASLLAHLDARSYIVDPKAHALIYRKDKEKPCPGETGAALTHCYEEIYHLNEPCESCPLTLLAGGAQIPAEGAPGCKTGNIHKIKWINGQEYCLIHREAADAPKK